MHTYFINHSGVVLELVVCCGVVLVGHCWVVVETKNWPGMYEVVEIEEAEMEAGC